MPAARTSHAFGMPISATADFELEELGHAAPRPDPTRLLLDPDAVERRWVGADARRVGGVGLPGAEVLTVDFDASRGYLVRDADGAAHLVSGDGTEVLCTPAGAWRDLLVGQLLPIASTLRGFEVLHASGVVVDGRAVLVSGPPGAGKSSVALRLVLDGGTLLSDDAVAVDDGLVAHPGSNALRLRPAEEALLLASARGALEPRGDRDGRTRYLAPRAPASPIGMLVLVDPTSDEGPATREVHAAMAAQLLGASFSRAIRTPDRLLRQLDRMARLARDVPVLAVRGRAFASATALAAHLRELVR